MNQEFIDIPRKRVKPTALVVPRAREFASYLAAAGPQVFALLQETARTAQGNDEMVIFAVKVERPQKPVYDIRKEERFAVIFYAEDNQFPEVVSLRRDFPKAPHLNLRAAEIPRSLCLYDQPYESVRLTWTPATFLSRIRHWLAMTAVGKLHGADQPLEPFIIGSGMYLILPSDFATSDIQQHRLLDVFICGKNDHTLTLKALWQDAKSGGQADHIATAFSCLPQTHGVIRQLPTNLLELHEFCQLAGLDLLASLTSTVQQWHIAKPAPKILKAKLVIIIALPKARIQGGAIETVETRAVLTGKTVEEVGISLGAIQTFQGNAGYVLEVKAPSPDLVKTIPVSLLQIVTSISPASSAHLNGTTETAIPMIGIGMGAIGSQVFNNLIRSGFGQWVLIDDDLLLPHNCARHFLGNWAVGSNKAEAMAFLANAIFDGKPIATAIPANILKPDLHTEAIDKAFSDARLVLDLSASVPVARHIASMKQSPRAICAYMTPTGQGLILAAEDNKRHVRLDWLEMLHYRAVLTEKSLRHSFRPSDAQYRYGNSCRDVSSQLAQDDAALWAAAASKGIKEMQKVDDAALRIYSRTSDGAVTVLFPTITRPLAIRLHDWTIALDKWLLTKLSRFRRVRLPNETGGVLIGAFDTERHICTLVDALPSPPDSKEWPTSYIRGCEGLAKQVKAAGSLTLDQLGYVGEWHSHPDGATTHPSNDDYQAYAWLVGHMHAESLPGVMLIVGEGMGFHLVSVEPTSRKGIWQQ